MTRNNEKISLLIEKLKSINENIFFDLLVDNFNNELLEKKFGKPFNKNSIFFEREIDIIGKIDESNKDFLRKIVETNNSYVEKKCLNFVKEDYLREFQRDKILRVNGRGLNPEQMIMYVLSTNKLVEFLDFFKKIHEEGNTVIMITHDNSIAVEAKRVIRIADGKINFDGSSEDYAAII